MRFFFIFFMSISTATNYRQRVAQEVTLPSGAIFKLRKIAVGVYLKNGKMPEHLFRRILGKWEAVKHLDTALAEQNLAKELSPEEIEKILVFQADVVAAACVEPRLVTDADGTKDDELNPNELTQADFIFIFGWAISGGGEAKNLENFRRRRK